jgi:hypothetical protein
MNIMLEEYRKRLLSNNDCYEKSYLPKEKQEKLNNKVKEGFSDEENPFKKYYYEEISKDNFQFYEKKPADLTDSEFNLYMSIYVNENVRVV